MKSAATQVKGLRYVRTLLNTLFAGSMMFHLYCILSQQEIFSYNQSIVFPLLVIMITTLVAAMFKGLELKRWRKTLLQMLIWFVSLNALALLFKVIFLSQ